MSDSIEKIGKSMIQHGKRNDRVYVMKLSRQDYGRVLKRADELCREEGYSKIFVKAPLSLGKALIERGYRKEAEVSRLFRGEENGLFLGKYLKAERRLLKDEAQIREVREIVKGKMPVEQIPVLSGNYRIGELTEGDAESMAALYRSVFASYPFPVFDPSYLKKTMGEDVEYGGIFRGDELVSVASAEKSPGALNAEMTDFATLPGHRGQNLSLILLKFLEKKLETAGYKTLYTIARALSIPMNVTFRKGGYRYSGTLVNNTDIGGGIESMNVWAREL